LTAGRTLTVDTNGLGATFNGSFTGSGGVTKNGLGVLRMTGQSDYTGDTRIDAGTLRVDGTLADTHILVSNGATLGGHGTVDDVTVESGGTFSLGDSVGAFDSTGDFTLESGSQTLLRIASLSLHDHLNVTGTFFAGGLLEIMFVDDFSPLVAGRFDLFDAGEIQGTFTDVLLPSLVSGLEWNLSELYTEGSISLQLSSVVPEPSSWAMITGLSALIACVFSRPRRTKQPSL
jgi:autotransporter-associated beta strand protein